MIFRPGQNSVKIFKQKSHDDQFALKNGSSYYDQAQPRSVHSRFDEQESDRQYIYNPIRPVQNKPTNAGNYNNTQDYQNNQNNHLNNQQNNHYNEIEAPFRTQSVQNRYNQANNYPYSYSQNQDTQNLSYHASSPTQNSPAQNSPTQNSPVQNIPPTQNNEENQNYTAASPPPNRPIFLNELNQQLGKVSS
jgi:hypothetical protein